METPGKRYTAEQRRRNGFFLISVVALAGCDQRAIDAIGMVFMTLILVVVMFLAVVHIMLLALLVANTVMLLKGRSNAALGVITIIIGIFDGLALLYIAMDPEERAPLHTDDFILTIVLVFGFVLASALIFVGVLSFKNALSRAASIAPVVPEIEPPLPPRAAPPVPPPVPPNTLGPPWP